MLVMIGLVLLTNPVPVAVMDLRAEGLDAVQVARYSHRLETLVATTGLAVVAPTEHRRLEDAQVESYRPCYDESCQIELGKSVAAAKMVSATWANYEGTCFFELRLYDLKTELAEFSTEVRATSCNAASVLPAMDSAIRNLARKIGNATEVATATVEGVRGSGSIGRTRYYEAPAALPVPQMPCRSPRYAFKHGPVGWYPVCP